MIQTKRLNIIPLETEHLESLRKLRNDPTTNHWLTDITPISAAEQQAWFEKISRDKSKMYLAIMVQWSPANLSGMNEWVFAGVLRSDEWDRVNRSVRVGIDIVPKFRGKGYAAEAFSAFIDYLFKQQNMNKVWLLVAEPNEVARKLYKKLGFIEEGTQVDALFRDGKYHNYISMSILKKLWKKHIK